jgi:hypothetical protein
VGGVVTAIKPDPLYNALVYIPTSGTPDPIVDSLQCDQCSTASAPSALVSAITGPDGKFTLSNVPVGANIPIVIQLGKWRRYYSITNVNPCVDNPLAADNTRLPRWQQETSTYDNIPRMALATGNVDALECVLRKMGIDDREFVAGVSSGTGNPKKINGRVQFYLNNGAVAKTATPAMSVLTDNVGVIDAYDAVLLACEGQETLRSDPGLTNLRNYAAAGGRVFGTHYNYTWIRDNNGTTNYSAGSIFEDWGTSANWSNANLGYGSSLSPSGGDYTPYAGYIDTSFTKGKAFDAWLAYVGALTGTSPDYFNIIVARADVIDDTATTTYPSQRWVYGTSPEFIEQLAFNTPIDVATAQQCGRVMFSDFHVNTGTTSGKTFPAECSDVPLTAQERVLEFELFDLSSCVSATNAPPAPPPSCTPRTCAMAGASCGSVADGCGGLLSCGTCPSGTTCGGGGVPYVCGGPTCIKQTCASLGFSCGKAGDGCGGTLDCGTCTGGATCGGGGTPGVCGGPTCTPTTCAAAGNPCGYIADGCGGSLMCATCAAGTTCGGGGTPGVCGGPTCTPTTCLKAGASCGKIGDGCGGTIDCGSCTTPDTCGGGGTPSVCGHSTGTTNTCTPRTCAAAGASCGPVADGCGGLLMCGTCTPPETCGGGGTPYKCGAPSCTPATCASLGYNCGLAADGCGGLLNCGSCTSPQTCGGGTKPNICGGGVH